MFTIIIPTHERHDVLLRAIEYYQHFECKIVIADSSEEKLVYDFPDNVIYKHLPSVSYAKKISAVAEDITTPYVCMSGDDDYFLESSLQASIRFLDENPEFVSVQGRYWRFALIEGQVTFNPNYIPEANYCAVTDEDSFSRVVKSYNPYIPRFYAIHRTEIFIKAYRSCVDISICIMVELISVLVPMCYGKHKVLPMLWMVRDSHLFPCPDRYVKEIKETKSSPISQIIKNHNHLKGEVKGFLASEESRLVKQKVANNISGLVNSKKESDDIFNAAVESYVAWLGTNRNKVILKNIIKLIIPACFLVYYMQIKTSKRMGGEETGSDNKEALKKIRLSVLSFVKCYDENK
jgi:glycosyltransferase domain-containing protein